MVPIRSLFPILLLLSISITLPAQRADKKKAEEFAREARKAYRATDYNRAIEFFEKATFNDRRNVDYQLELSRAYFANREYRPSMRIVQPLSRSRKLRGPLQIEAIRIYASCLDLMDKQRQAIKIIENGLKEYPGSGELYFEYGLILLGNDDEVGAMAQFERGILTEPGFARNYLMGAEVLATQGNYGWAILYAEQYLNLERKSGWASDVSRFTYETYQKACLCGIGTCVFRFNDPMGSDSTGGNVQAGPYQSKMSEIYSLSLPENEGEFSIHLLYLVQIDAFDLMMQEGNSEAIMDYAKWLQQLHKRDHLESYNFWLMQNGAPLEFGSWLKDHEEEFQEFEVWFHKHSFLEFNKGPIVRPHALLQIGK